MGSHNRVIKGVYFRLLLSMLLLVSLSIYSRHFVSSNVHGYERTVSPFPDRIGGWEKKEDLPLDGKVLRILKVDEYVNSIYYKDGNSLSLYFGYYHNQRRFGEIHTPENCQKNSGWNVVVRKKERRYLSTEMGKTEVEYVSTIFSRNGKNYLFIYFYLFPNYTTTNFFKYKLMLIKNAFMRGRSDAGFVRIIIPVKDGEARETEKMGLDFLGYLIPEINEKLLAQEER